ncbi:RNA polymerase sigma-H factor [Mesobacillus persicus]|uniref:RNA polymerase sigma-H factor n=1 Tax=Mesobacillus persicus TaxID=930146 RepID=A0A1H7XP20_9BACI|nr:sigma-70 family RNA polymerase sigma factor [Mesobacillus persicus]SEM35652.1 RNA polymerase sigma-H factor [Mesobacillus persicus]
MSKYKEIPLEMIQKAKDGDEFAFNEIANQLRGLVKAIIKKRKYFLPGAEYDDVFQEGNIGIFKAIQSFEPEKVEEGNFLSFCAMCIDRQLIGAVKGATRKKHKALNESDSFDVPLPENDNMTFLDFASNSMNAQESLSYEFLDPIKQIEIQDKLEQLDRFKDLHFSDREKEIYQLFHIEGLTYQELEERLGVESKTIDNAIQRSRRKIDEFVEQIEQNQPITKKNLSDVLKKKTNLQVDVDEQVIRESLVKLNGMDRLLIEQHYLHGKTQQELAYELKKRLDIIHKGTFRALEKLKMVVEKEVIKSKQTNEYKNGVKP